MPWMTSFNFTHSGRSARLGTAMDSWQGRFDHDACGAGFLADREGRRRRELLALALGAIERLGHRGALNGDGETGDGAGVLTQIPWELLGPELAAQGLAGARADNLGLGMLFLPRDGDANRAAREAVAAGLLAQGLRLAG